MAAARDTIGGDEKIIAVIGDGSLTAGLAFEGLNQAGHLKRDLIVILNDNEMSISPNVGALSSFLSRKMTSDFFLRFRKETEHLLANIPRFGRDLVHLARRTEESIKGFFTPGMLFEAFGFDYIGPLNGHRLEELIETLQNVSRLKKPLLIHVMTRKGQGYAPAEKNPPKYHGVGPFDPATGEVLKGQPARESYTAIFGRTLTEMAARDERLVAITAAMLEGTGLKEFARRFPERFYDVGIAEQHAVTFAAGLACRGLRPVVAVYSTFLQRAYDNVLHDVCLQNLPVTFALDRGGLVGADGPTHHGVFDYSYLRHIPNLTFMAPRDENELRRAMVTAHAAAGPFAYRYPRGDALGVPLEKDPQPLAIGCGEKLRDGTDGVIFAIGTTVAAALQAAEELRARGIITGGGRSAIPQAAGSPIAPGRGETHRAGHHRRGECPRRRVRLRRSSRCWRRRDSCSPASASACLTASSSRGARRSCAKCTASMRRASPKAFGNSAPKTARRPCQPDRFLM